MVLGQIYGRSSLGHKFGHKFPISSHIMILALVNMFWGACSHHVTSPMAPCYPLWLLWHPVVPCWSPVAQAINILHFNNFWIIWATDMFEVSNQGFLGSLSPSRPSPGVPRGPRHVYHVSHLENLTFDLIELQQCAKGVDRGFQGCQVHLDVSHMAHVAMDMPTTCSTHYHILKTIVNLFWVQDSRVETGLDQPSNFYCYSPFTRWRWKQCCAEILCWLRKQPNKS